MKESLLGISAFVVIGIGFAKGWLVALAIVVVAGIVAAIVSRRRGEREKGQQKSRAVSARIANATSGTPTGDAAIMCPHCQTRGLVASKRVKRQVGVDGAKLGRAIHGSADGALGGVGRRENVTELSCGHCKMKWVVA